MKTKLAVLTAAMLLAAALPVSAQTSFAGEATATGLDLTVEGEGLTIGTTRANAQSGPVDDGCEGELLTCAFAEGLLGVSGAATAEHPGNEGPNEAVGGALPEEFEELLTLELGVAQAEAGEAGATGRAAASTLSVNATQTLIENLPEELTDGLEEVLDTILGPIFEEDPTGLSDLVEELIDNIMSAPLATIELGPSGSEVSTGEGSITATGLAAGAVITIAPSPELVEFLDGGPEGAIVIRVSQAQATATSDGAEATAAFDPAIVTIELAGQDPVVVGPGDSGCVAEDTPLEVCITAANGDTTEEGGAAAATAAGVAISLFADPLPVVNLELASAAAGVNLAQAEPPPPEEPEPEEGEAEAPAQPPPPEPAPTPLPRTGADLGLAGLGLLAVGGAVYGLRRRSG